MSRIMPSGAGCREDVIDTHAHLDIDAFDSDRAQVIQRALEAGVSRIINASFDLESSRRSVALAREYSYIYALVGVHPHDAGNVPGDYLEQISRLAQEPGVVALGEMGLDYYRNLSPREEQKKVFRQQLALARELNVPVVIHDRDAHGDVLDILRGDGVSSRGGILHCFSGSWEMARDCMSLGLYISIAGPVTYPNAPKLKEIAARLPLDRLLVETDCPYLAPQGYRGKRNEPSYVRLVVEEIARLRGIRPEQVAQAAYQNAIKVFNLRSDVSV